jgi:hypothetical protein
MNMRKIKVCQNKGRLPDMKKTISGDHVLNKIKIKKPQK